GTGERRALHRPVRRLRGARGRQRRPVGPRARRLVRAPGPPAGVVPPQRRGPGRDAGPDRAVPRLPALNGSGRMGAMKTWATTVVLGSLLLALLATLRGYDPGDAAGAVRMSSAREMAFVSGGVALASLLPVGWLRKVLVGLATVLLVVAAGFWVGL